MYSTIQMTYTLYLFAGHNLKSISMLIKTRCKLYVITYIFMHSEIFYLYVLTSFALANLSCNSHALHCIVQVGQTFACLHTHCICICVGFGKLCWGMTGCGLEP